MKIVKLFLIFYIVGGLSLIAADRHEAVSPSTVVCQPGHKRRLFSSESVERRFPGFVNPAVRARFGHEDSETGQTLLAPLAHGDKPQSLVGTALAAFPFTKTLGSVVPVPMPKLDKPQGLDPITTPPHGTPNEFYHSDTIFDGCFLTSSPKLGLTPGTLPLLEPVAAPE